MMHEGAFLQAIQAAPEDDAPRLLYADWLEERGDPRGEFIRVQCALETMAADDPRGPALRERERLLLAGHETEWVESLRNLSIDRCTFRRGLVDEVALEALTFLERGDELLQLAPVRRLCLTDLSDLLPELLRHPALARVTSLDLTANLLADEGASVLAAAPQLRHLTRLDLGNNVISSVGVSALAASPHLAGLTALHLGDDGGQHGLSNQLDLAAVQALAASPRLGQLTTLNLANSWLHDEEAEALAASTHLGRLTTLHLAGNFISDRGAAALATSPKLARLTALDLSDNCYIRDRAALIASGRTTRNWGLAADPNPAVESLRAELLQRRGASPAPVLESGAGGRIPLATQAPPHRNALVLETRCFRADAELSKLGAWTRADDFLASLGYPVRLRAYNVDAESAQNAMQSGNTVDAREIGREAARHALTRLLYIRLFRSTEWTYQQEAERLADCFLDGFEPNSRCFGQADRAGFRFADDVVVVVGKQRVGLLWMGDAG